MKIYTTLSDETLEQAAKNIDLILRAKNTNVINMIVRDEDLQVVDITGSTVFFTVKDTSSQTDVDAILKKDVTSHTFPTGGETDIELTSADTSSLLGNYLYSIKIKDSDGNIYTLAEGNITFQKEITTRES